jgi:hypothetical protein
MEAYEEARHLLVAANKDLRALRAMFDPQTLWTRYLDFTRSKLPRKL